MGERNVSICKEMTKINEEVFRGKTHEILILIKEKVLKTKIILIK